MALSFSDRLTHEEPLYSQNEASKVNLGIESSYVRNKQELRDQDLFKELNEQHGLEESDIIKQVTAVMLNSDFQSRLALKHLGRSASYCSGVSTETIINRTIEAAINVNNAKSFAFSFQFFDSQPYPEFEALTQEYYLNNNSNLCAASTVNLTSDIKARINIDLVDNLSLSVVGLDRLTDVLLLMPQLALIEVVKSVRKKK